MNDSEPSKCSKLKKSFLIRNFFYAQLRNVAVLLHLKITRNIEKYFEKNINFEAVFIESINCFKFTSIDTLFEAEWVD